MKNNSLEGIRGVAAFGVLLAHLLLSLFPYLAINQHPTIQIPQFYAFESVLILPPIMAIINGSFGVSVFFVLSGYVLTNKFFRTGDVSILQAGAVKRYPRLIIPAAISVMFAWVILSLGLMNVDKIPVLGGAGWPYGQYSTPVTFLRALYDAILGAPLLGSVGLNNPLWTIQVELLGSMFLFAVYALFGTRHLIATTLAFVFLLTLVRPSDASQVHYYAMFAGSLLNIFEPWLKRHAKASTALFICGWALGGFDYSPYYSLIHSITFPAIPAPLPNLAGQSKLVVMSVGAVLLIGGVLGSSFIAKLLNRRAPQFLARISYSSYLLHWPIICSLGFGLQYVFFVKLGLPHLVSSLLTCIITIPTILLVAKKYTDLVDGRAVRFANYLSQLYWRHRSRRLVAAANVNA